MGLYLKKGVTFAPGGEVNHQLLNAHVDDGEILPTAITSQPAASPMTLDMECLLVSGGIFYKATVEQIHDLLLYPGSIVQTVYEEYVANANLSTIIPADDSVPQSGEGVQALTLSITPRFSDSKILLEFEGQVASSVAPITVTAALFKNAETPAIASRGVAVQGAVGFFEGLVLKHMDSPASTSAQTYRIRIGPGATATIRMNGESNGRTYGGSSRATLTAYEIKQ